MVKAWRLFPLILCWSLCSEIYFRSWPLHLHSEERIQSYCLFLRATLTRDRAICFITYLLPVWPFCLFWIFKDASSREAWNRVFVKQFTADIQRGGGEKGGQSLLNKNSIGFISELMKALSIQCKTAYETRNSRSVHWICFRVFSNKTLTVIKRIRFIKSFFSRFCRITAESVYSPSLTSVMLEWGLWGKKILLCIIFFEYTPHDIYMGTGWCFLGFSWWFIYLTRKTVAECVCVWLESSESRVAVQPISYSSAWLPQWAFLFVASGFVPSEPPR